MMLWSLRNYASLMICWKILRLWKQILLFESGFDIEDASMIVDEVDIFEGYIFMIFDFLRLVEILLVNLSIVSCSFDVVSLVDLNLLIEYVADDYEIDGSVA